MRGTYLFFQITITHEESFLWDLNDENISQVSVIWFILSESGHIIIFGDSSKVKISPHHTFQHL